MRLSSVHALSPSPLPPYGPSPFLSALDPDKVTTQVLQRWAIAHKNLYEFLAKTIEPFAKLKPIPLRI